MFLPYSLEFKTIHYCSLRNLKLLVENLPLNDVAHFVTNDDYFGVGIGGQVGFNDTANGWVYCAAETSVWRAGDDQLSLVAFLI